MYFANPWGLLGLLALPAIAYIHLFQRRYPPLFVAGLHLWAVETQVRMPGRKRERLPVTPTLLLELLAALLLSVVLADPRWGDWSSTPHLVAILDQSASMQGQGPDGQSFRDEAVRRLEERFKGLGRRGVVTLIQTGSLPVTLCRRAEIAEARKALETWQPNAPQHRLASAWEELGKQFVDEHGKMLFLTDSLPAANEVPPNLEVISLGRKLPNIAFNAARWSFDAETAKGKIYVRLQSYADVPLQAKLQGLNRDGQEIFTRDVAIEAKDATALQLEVPGGLGLMKLKLSCPDDALAIDNEVLLVEPKLRSVKVAVTLPDGVAQRQMNRVLKILPEVNLVSAGEAQLLIGPAEELPASNPRLWWLGIGPLDPSPEARKAAKDLSGPYLIDKRHPLLEGITLGGIVWGGAQQPVLPPAPEPAKPEGSAVPTAPAEPVAQPSELARAVAGEMPLISSGKLALLGELRGTATTAYLLNLDLTRTNLTESPDWPVLIDNLLELRRDAMPGLRAWSYRMGEVVRFRLYEGSDLTPTESLTLVHNGDVRKLVREPVVEISGLNETGLYEIKSGDVSLGQFAVNFYDATESNLLPLRPGELTPTIPLETPRMTLDSPFTWLLWLGTLAILLTIFADWYVLRPRTVG